MTTEIRAALERARGERPELGPTIDLQLELMGIGDEAATVVPPGFAEIAAARMDAGLPAIDAHTLELDWEALARRITASDAAEARELAIDWLRGELEDPLEALVVTHALRPLLRPLCDAALASPAAARWTGGHCPCCGGPPDFAALDGEGGARRLLCSRCDAEWRHARVGCPFCANLDAATLAYFPVAEGRYRLYVCEVCRRYLKTLDRREVWNAEPLPAERILAIGLDVAARNAGYRGAERLA